ncbi:putative N,O-diacetyl muramidase [Delitschia confertaspora ATCC 74209]|uniref:Lysozyme n=1 Tax=Delitschia confertaspora ATCC 74209 TaxID=1513339 RepID=A0A9P4MW83_9PLEO|nr:putative N,O-diacetyl muramidase [Delitschia confertaspora ATCC 74209]
MVLLSTLAALALHFTLSTAQVQGFDVSNYQGNVDMAGAYGAGARFVIIKATEGDTFVDPYFSANYDAATGAGLIRGGYHFGRPDGGSGASQAQFFVSNGGGWSGDGITLPGTLDIEYGPTDTCYGLDVASMVAWITDFVNMYQSLTGRWPMIYTTNDWWTTCTGNDASFSANCPLFLASYSTAPGVMPGGWPFQTIWQYDSAYAYGGDSDSFNGDEAGLAKLATG